MAKRLITFIRTVLLLFIFAALLHCGMGGTEVGNPRPAMDGETAPTGDEEASPSPTLEGGSLIEEDLDQEL